MTKNTPLFILWFTLSLGLAGYLAHALWGQEQADALYLPDVGSHGHYQIELACDACHGDGFASEDEVQQGCLNCHKEELKQADDSHPVKKFTDPRNADRLEILDARYCVTCHVEHVPDRTRDMGVTLADDFCVLCHQEVGEERASHEGLSFDGCSAAGCHNYHDNRALYEDFLVKHAADPATKAEAILPLPDYRQVYQQQLGEALKPGQMDADEDGNNPNIIDEWAVSRHAASGINCTDCHQSPWQMKPTIEVCNDCHQDEMKGFTEGRHGMRHAQQLPLMKTADSRQAMKSDALDKMLSCNSCHDVHSVDTSYAAVEACMGCHNDQHSTNYKQSPHYSLWQAELDGRAVAGSGVSCASCHLPRLEKDGVVRVQHNQNHNLRPNEKMIREVCMQCHSLSFSIDSLADQTLIDGNFNGQSNKHVESIGWAVDRVK